MEKYHYKQARVWLAGAEYIAQLANAESENFSVAVAMLVHAIIKANDALTFKFMNMTARRHDDTRRLFEELIKKNVLPAASAPYAQIIQDAITNKAKAEYRVAYFSKNDFDTMQRKAKKFLAFVEGIV
ncbi:MAG: hypothetical protein Q8R53_00815 [Nanoarchaeota archaeon]|nr:hypothetical protein [Nanoarchaeota archaeon]